MFKVGDKVRVKDLNQRDKEYYTDGEEIIITEVGFPNSAQPIYFCEKERGLYQSQIELVQDKEAKFNIGDKVKVTKLDTFDTEMGELEIGDVLTIKEVSTETHGEKGHYHIVEEYMYGVYDSQIEAVQDEPELERYNIGDLVRVVDLEDGTADHRFFSIGDEVIVTENDHIHDGKYVHFFDDNSRGLYTDQLELVKSADELPIEESYADDVYPEDEEPMITITELDNTFQVDVPMADDTGETVPLIFLDGKFLAYDELTNDTQLYLTPAMVRAIVNHAVSKARKA